MSEKETRRYEITSSSKASNQDDKRKLREEVTRLRNKRQELENKKNSIEEDSPNNHDGQQAASANGNDEGNENADGEQDEDKHPKKGDNEDESEENDEEENDEEENDEEENDEDSEEGEDSEESEDNEGNNEDEDGEDNEKDDDDKEDPEDKELSKGSSSSEEDGVRTKGRKNLQPDRSGGANSKGAGGDEKGSGIKNIADRFKNKHGGAEDLSKAAELKNKAKKIQQGASAISSGATSVATFAGKVVVNPVFWVSLLAVTAIIYISSTMAIIGQNDYNIVCDENGVGNVSLDNDADDFTRQSAIASWLMSTPFDAFGGKPMTREQAMGVMGNLIEESGGANPKTIQSGYKSWETCDNDCVAAFEGGGKAVGILQWDGATGDPRRDNLVKLAREEGTEWYDLNTQLKHLKRELDGEGSHKFENHQIRESGFVKTGKTIEEYTLLWSEHIERCGVCRNDERVASAKEFDSKYSGGGSVTTAGGGLASNCIGSGGGSDVDTSSLVGLAISMAWPAGERIKSEPGISCGGNPNCGQNFATPEYIKAKKVAEIETGGEGIPGLLASCDRYVATAYRASGKDLDFPWGPTGLQISYMRNSSKWKEVSCKDRKPGDVLWREGHIMLYLGDVNGVDSIGSASIGNRGASRTGLISPAECSGDLFYADGGSAQGYRLVE